MYPTLAVFDIAGTTVNDFGLVQKTLIEVFNEFTGIKITEARANEIMGIRKDVAFKQLCLENNQPSSEATIQNLLQDFESRLTKAYGQPGALEPMPYAIELFKSLQLERCLVYLDTGFSRKITDIIIKNLDWGSLINGSIASDEVLKGRPEPDMIFEVMKRIKLTNASLVAKIGDTQSDLLEGHHAGCGWVIGICTGAYTREELLQYPHTNIIDSLSEMPQIFK